MEHIAMFGATKAALPFPDETSATKDNTTTNNQSLTYTGIMTIHEFTKPGASQRALVVDERDGKAVLTTFFDEVTTIDTHQKDSIKLNRKRI